MEEIKVGDSVRFYDHNLRGYTSGKIVQIRYDVACCQAIGQSHIHAVLYDVQRNNGKVSHGHFPWGIVRCH